MNVAFTTPIVRDGDTLTGPFRHPRQMLANQEYGSHLSIHDDETASALGLAAAPIEGPTHFSQFDPLAFELWGPAWFERGCVSAHFETMVVEGEAVQASLTPTGAASAVARVVKATGERALVASVSLGKEATELDARLARALGRSPGVLHIVDGFAPGWRAEPWTASITYAEPNGPLYPFTLAHKLEVITEASPWYESADASPWGRCILPTEMLSVLAYKSGEHPPVRQPSVGLFIDLEVRRHTPLFVGETYSATREVVCTGQSSRVESFWTRTELSDRSGRAVATVLLHEGVFKDSYPGYPA
jgi:hypothetical protein